MFKLGILLDNTVDQLKVSNLFKDASNVSLSFVDGQYKLLKDTVDRIHLTKTSQPKAIIDSITLLKKEGVEHIIILTSSQLITYSYQQALLAKEILNDTTIDIIDTKTFGPGILYLLMCIKRFMEQKYSYSKIVLLLKKHIDLGTTFVVTSYHHFEVSHIKIQKLMKPFIKSYILNSKSDYKVDHVIYSKKKVLSILYQQIKGLKGYHHHTSIFVYGGMNPTQPKLLQHELFTKDKVMKVYLYGSLSEGLLAYFGQDVYGIYIGYYEEEII